MVSSGFQKCTFIGLFQFPISVHTRSEHGTLITKTDYPNFVVARNSFRTTNKILYLPFTAGVNSNKYCFWTKPKLFWESGNFSGNQDTWKFFQETVYNSGTLYCLTVKLIIKNHFCKNCLIQKMSLVIDFYQMWWLLKEAFLATCSAMSNQHLMKQSAVAPRRAVF